MGLRVAQTPGLARTFREVHDDLKLAVWRAGPPEAGRECVHWIHRRPGAGPKGG